MEPLIQPDQDIEHAQEQLSVETVPEFTEIKEQIPAPAVNPYSIAHFPD